MNKTFNFVFVSVVTVLIIFSVNFSFLTENENASVTHSVNKNHAGALDNKISEAVKQKKNTHEFKKFNLLTTDNSGSKQISGVSNAVYLEINQQEHSNLLKLKPECVILNIQSGVDKSFELELIRSFPLSEDFRLGIISGKRTEYKGYTGGIHYNGIIKGDNSSVVSVSIFKSYMMAVISDNSGNYNLSPVNSLSHGKYILFNDRELTETSGFKCDVDDYDSKFSPKTIANNNTGLKNNISYSDNSTGGAVNIYFECDFKMYTDFSSNTDSVMNYVSAFFNSVKTLYTNESVQIQISQVFVWITQDPYLALPTTLRILKRFSHEKQNNFNGHLAHLLSTRTPNIGGIAWLDVLCFPYLASDSAGPTGFSSIYTTYSIFPVWSYTIQVVAHELGHNFASKHTHACVWPIPGGIGALDSCYAVEGSCYTGPPIARVGTVMSYCIFASGGSISFTLGFGPRPGDTIRAAYGNAPCVIGIQNISSEIPNEFKLMQNYPNPFNPVTNIEFLIPTSGNVSLKIYDVNGREIETLISQKLTAGTYRYDWDASLYSSGIYFYTLESGNYKLSKKMILIK